MSENNYTTTAEGVEVHDDTIVRAYVSSDSLGNHKVMGVSYDVANKKETSHVFGSFTSIEEAQGKVDSWTDSTMTLQEDNRPSTVEPLSPENKSKMDASLRAYGEANPNDLQFRSIYPDLFPKDN